jgi:Protein of unknown function (DUF3489)
MLKRPEGASVAEIGQRLGWLRTVRAAMMGSSRVALARRAARQHPVNRSLPDAQPPP